MDRRVLLRVQLEICPCWYAARSGMMHQNTFDEVSEMKGSAVQYKVIAHNYAFDSENKIHSDDVASRYGFKGGLVPGVADIAYLARSAYDLWGEDWLRGGTIEVKLIKPVYHGENATARAVPNAEASHATLELSNEVGELCAAGTAGRDDAGPPPSADEFSKGPPPEFDARPAPTALGFPAGHLLGAYEYRHNAVEAGKSARDMFVDEWPEQGRIANFHPATALHHANRMLRANVALGPWIHTGSRLELHGQPADGAWISLCGHVLETYEKRGHIVTDVDMAMFADDRPIARIKHSAIIRLAGTSD
jgi:hypothetical protein